MGTAEAILLYIVVMPISLWLFMIAVEYLLVSWPLKNKSPEEAVKVMQRHAFKQYRGMTPVDYAKMIVAKHNKTSVKMLKHSGWFITPVVSAFFILEAVRFGWERGWIFIAGMVWFWLLTLVGRTFQRRIGDAPLNACTSYLETVERDSKPEH